MKRTTIVLPDELAELIEHEAKRQGISVSELIRRFIRRSRLGPRSSLRPIPWAGIVDDPEMVRGEDVEEKLTKWWADDLGHHP